VAIGLLFLFGNYNLLSPAVLNKAWPALLVASGAYLAFCGIKEGMENKTGENKRTKTEGTKRRRNKRTNNI